MKKLFTWIGERASRPFRRLATKVERLAEPAPLDDECPICWGSVRRGHKRACPLAYIPPCTCTGPVHRASCPHWTLPL